MEGVAQAMARPRTRLSDRLVAALLLLMLVIGGLGLWIGVPVVTLWVLARVTDSSTLHFVLGMIGVPLAMALFAPCLIWVNALYLRVTGTHAFEDDEDAPRRGRGPLEPILVACFVAALIAFLVWFLLFAENPLQFV